MYHAAFADTADLRERRYLVATLLVDTWLPRALVSDFALAEKKASYWSEIYGPPRTRISEVWVAAGRPRKPVQAPPEPIEIALAPVQPRQRRRWTDKLAALDRPFDPSYAKAMVDGFLLYVGSQLAFRLLEILKFGSLALA